jgi:predicted esterase
MMHAAVRLSAFAVLLLFPQDKKPVQLAGEVADPEHLGIMFSDGSLAVLEAKGVAEKSGLKIGDTIKKIEGTEVASWDDCVGVFQNRCLAAELRLDVDRDGKNAKVTLKLSANKAAITGGRGGKSGGRSIKADGKDRTYEVKAPPAATKGAPMPLLVLLHGDGGTGKGMIDWTPAANQEAVILALDGIGQSWRDASDLAFVLAAIDAAKAEFNVDLRRVYALGFSSGAFLAYKLGVERGHVFAAVGCYEGAASPSEKPSKRKTAFVFLAGANDPTVRATDIKRAGDDLKTRGHAVEYLEIKNLDHDYKSEHSKALWERVKTYVIK